MIENNRFVARGAPVEPTDERDCCRAIATRDEQFDLRFGRQRPGDAPAEMPIAAEDDNAEGHDQRGAGTYPRSRSPRRWSRAAEGPLCRATIAIGSASIHRADYALVRCAAMTKATHAVSFFAYGTCRNSFGPWAFECGPRTPVMRNCASGKCLPSMAMKGIVPPSPTAAEGLA